MTRKDQDTEELLQKYYQSEGVRKLQAVKRLCNSLLDAETEVEVKSSLSLLPIDRSFDLIIDLISHISTIFREGGFGSKKNSDLKFLDDEKMDAMGYSPQVTINFPKERYGPNPFIADYLDHVTEKLVEIKQHNFRRQHRYNITYRTSYQLELEKELKKARSQIRKLSGTNFVLTKIDSLSRRLKISLDRNRLLKESLDYHTKGSKVKGFHRRKISKKKNDHKSRLNLGNNGIKSSISKLNAK